jgi:regulator of nucleoside diphosphate kinase
MATGEADTYILVYPGEASFEDGKLSVLAPLGSAIMGERVGDVVRVRAPAGTHRVKIELILSLPGTPGRRGPVPVR